MYGWRCRIGLIIPSSNTTMESEFSKFTPEGFSIHASRLPLKKVTEKELIIMSEEVERCSKLLAQAGVDVIVYGCTSGSLIKGRGYDQELENKISGETGLPAVSTAGAVMEALQTEGFKKIAVATPYIDEINRKEEEFLLENGIEVSEIKGLGLADNIKIGRCEATVAYRLGKEVIKSNPQADALFISCTNFRTFGVINTLAQDIEKPVITSNLATLKSTLRKVGLSDALANLNNI